MSESSRDLRLAVKIRRMRNLRIPLMAMLLFNLLLVGAALLSRPQSVEAKTADRNQINAKPDLDANKRKSADDSESADPSSASDSPSSSQPARKAPVNTSSATLTVIDLDDPNDPFIESLGAVDDQVDQGSAAVQGMAAKSRTDENNLTNLADHDAGIISSHQEPSDIQRIQTPELEKSPTHQTLTQTVQSGLAMIDDAVAITKNRNALTIMPTRPSVGSHDTPLRSLQRLHQQKANLPYKMLPSLTKSLSALAKNKGTGERLQQDAPSSGVVLRNPKQAGGAVHYLIGETAHTLHPGESHELGDGQEWLIRFHRGDELGDARYQLSQGEYLFHVTEEKGWELTTLRGS